MKKRFILFFPLIFLFCAKEGMPPGGPEDKTPPSILHTIPPINATQVDMNSDIEIWFSEPVQSGAVKDAVFITPYPQGDVKLKWRRKRLIIEMPQVLQKDQTYVITLGTGIRDYRNNALKASFILAFSTGDSLDQGEITGHVFLDEKASGIGVWAYPIQEGEEPDPRKKSPDYIVQCSENGEFKFSHMALRSYRLFVVQDRLADRLYQPVQDGIGMTYKDINLLKVKNLKAGPVYFRLTQEDTLAPRLVRAVSVQNNLVSLQFNEPIVVDPVKFSMQIYFSDSLKSGMNFQFFSYYQDPKLYQWLHIITEPQKDGYHYSVFVKGIRDLAGHEIDTAFQKTDFKGIGLPDTIAPAWVDISPKNKEKAVDLNPLIEFVFSEDMDTTEWISHISLIDQNQRKIQILADTLGGVQWTFNSSELLQGKSDYQLVIDSLLRDLSGNVLKDTVIKFSTINPDTLSDVSGEIFDPDSSSSAPIVILLQKLDKNNKVHQVTLPRPGRYHFTSVFPGLYSLWGFEDLDENGLYSYGCSYPYQPAERFFVLQDTIKARSNWSNTGNDCLLPSLKK